MASKLDETEKSVKEEMEEFPCMFNLTFQREISQQKLKSLKNKLVEELQVEGDEFDEEEKVRNKNFLTWIHFRLNKLEQATVLNNEVMELTGEQNMTALGNRVFLSWYNGDVFGGQKCLRKLRSMKSRPNFQKILSRAKAEQAYCYDRMGGGYHCEKAIKLYKEALEQQPDKALWEFGLGLVYRKMANVNLNLSSPERGSINEYTKMAAESLFKVTDNDNAAKNLQSQAFAQLTSLRQAYPHRFYPQYDRIFRDQSLRQLCDKALESGSTIPSVLTTCGKSLKTVDVDRAIWLLEESVKIREVNPIAYHHLALSYIKKAERKTQPSRARRGQSHQEWRQREQHRSSSDAPRTTLTSLDTYINSPDKSSPLRKEDDLVRKAIHALEKCLSTSKDGNLPALLNLGQILKRTSQRLYKSFTNW